MGEPARVDEEAAARARARARCARAGRDLAGRGSSSYWSHQILIETFLFGIAASSLIFLSAYGGMVSLGQTALFGIAGIIMGNLATKGGPGGTSKGLHLGWDPTVALSSRSR